jgi:NAD(P)-dependent dehydrogenase (short-subunit alcohol dehydrogenase family)
MSKTHPKHIIVMTGATSGIGAAALKHLIAQPNTEIIVGARGSREISGVIVLPLDLGSLESVRNFAEAVKKRLANAKIHMLVLNAGAQFRTRQRSVNGFEMTFAVNYLAHYLLARLLVPCMAEGGRLVITTSDTHDPSIMPGAPKTLDPDSLAHPKETGSGVARAYAASKLCDLLMARSFAVLDYVKQRHIGVIAYNPGLTGGTSLGGQSALKDLIMTALRLPLRFMSLFRPQLYMHTPEQSGEALAELVLGHVTPPSGRVYASHVRDKITFPDPAKLAQSDEARDRLWRESAIMVGLQIGSTEKNAGSPA